MAYGEFKRWLYRGQRPHAAVRLVNRIWATLAAWGVAPRSLALARLEVVGRKSGRVTSLPVVPAVLGGQRYLVSMLGEKVQWVQNVRAAAGNAVLECGRREEVRLSEVPVAQRAAIIKAYLHQAPGARPHVPVDKDAPLPAFERLAPAIPVFHVSTAGIIPSTGRA